MSVKIRKLVTVVEEILSDGGRQGRRPLRAAVAGGTAIIPSAKKLGGPGTTIAVSPVAS